MTSNETQEAIENAFLWVHRVYGESTALLNTASELFAHAGFVCWDANPQVLRGSHTAYLLGHLFSTQKQYDAKSGTDMFVAVSLFPDQKHPRGKGPVLLAGTLNRKTDVVNWGFEVVNVAARAPGAYDLYRMVSSDDGLLECEPTAAATSKFPGCGPV
jgi:hypothetical protein